MNNKKINYIKSKYIKLKNENSLQSQNELVEKQIEFKNNYSIKNLITKDNEDLLIFLFLNAGRQDSVGYHMESGLLKDANYFGTYGQMQAPIMLNKNGQWVYQDPHKRQQIEVSQEEALKIANIVKSKIIKISNIMEDVKNNKKDYAEILNEFNSILQDVLLRRSYMYFRKYIFNLYPDMMSSFINNNNKKNFMVQKIKNFLEIEKSNHTIPLIAEYVIYKYFGQYSVNDIFHIIAKFAEDYNELELDENEINDEDDNMTKQPLNQILYGPPGTGKTYNTVIKAMEIVGLKKLFQNWYMETSNAQSKEKTFKDYCNAIEVLNTKFKVAIFHILDKNIFEKLKSKITTSENFVNEYKHAETSSGTSYYDSALNQYGKFLNNLTYEDLKTEFNELRRQGRIEFVTFHQSYSYEEFVEGIKPDTEIWGSSVEKLTYKGCDGVFKKICERAEGSFATANFDDVYAKFLDEILNTDGLFKLKTKKYEKTFGLEVNNNDNLNIYMGENLVKQGSLTKENIKAHFLNSRKRTDWANYYDSVVEHLETKYNLKKENVGTQPYVLIIDEINRGNISKIFGELITLIEDDKRSDLKVKLPYSHDDFSVPKNLYIIGTMNTSDRSIASIDIALRRRFKFEEMMPKSDIEGFRKDFKEYFDILNRRISFLLDRDHQIGHSYFLNEKEKLEDVWFDSVMPLLNEYFYGDWGKLQNILGYAQDENKVEKNQKYTSFIKKICAKDLNLKGDTSCLEDCYYDFVSKDEIDFKKALENAFGKNDKKVVSDSELQE